MRTAALAYTPADDLASAMPPTSPLAPPADPTDLLAALGEPAAAHPQHRVEARGPQLKLHYDVDSLDNRDPWFVENMIRIVERVMYPYHRAEVHGVERVPRGAALY